jgi:prepilin-type N-terminal cleavage/methylation domain-containing protein
VDNQNNNLRQREGGFTLLEVMLAVGIIAVFFAVLIVSRDDIISTAANSNSLRIARMLASQKMEEVLLSEVAEEGEETLGGTFENYPGFSWEESTEEISLTTDEELDATPDMQQTYVTLITITVEYENAGGTKSQYSLATVVPSKEETK